MREPLSKFPKRPNGPDVMKRTIAECRAMLANARLSPEMRTGLEQRIAQLQAELQADAANRAREAEFAAAAAAADESENSARWRRR
jgi:uncharacterized coiled-coil DUF342 family protein